MNSGDFVSGVRARVYRPSGLFNLLMQTNAHSGGAKDTRGTHGGDFQFKALASVSINRLLKYRSCRAPLVQGGFANTKVELSSVII